MLDTDSPEMYEEIIENMKKVGLDAKELCAIFHSHEHKIKEGF